MSVVYVHLIFVAVLCEKISEIASECNYTSAEGPRGSFDILSRRKRFLTFPDGSSFQLVFCIQTTALIPISDIFLYSSTAALAWNLPKDPMNVFSDSGFDRAQRRWDGQKRTHNSDKRPPIPNPVFAKRSVDNSPQRPKQANIKIDKKRMHENQLRREFLKRRHMDSASVRFHRTSRVGLYGKLEKLFEAVGKEGKQCVLKQLCKAAKLPGTQEAFLDEILRVVFTLPKYEMSEEFNEAEHRHYDNAFDEATICDDRYPECDW